MSEMKQPLSQHSKKTMFDHWCKTERNHLVDQQNQLLQASLQAIHPHLATRLSMPLMPTDEVARMLVKEMMIKAIKHNIVTFTMIVKTLNTRRTLWRSPYMLKD